MLETVLTSSEDTESLKKLADGLVKRYSDAEKTPPEVLYTDRDCCSEHRTCKMNALFADWKSLNVQLDIWHFMRRLALGVTTESHPMYGTFMAQLSSCLLEWGSRDYKLLMSAKKGEMISAGIPDPTESAFRKAISKEELARHCQRRTRGVQNTTQLIEALLLSLSAATDTLRMPLLKEEMKQIWSEQKKHITCIQDPPGIELYTITHHITKGGVRLPVFRCARGFTSLESFHLHFARFVPGSSANTVNFQAYLLDGITRWNSNRANAAIESIPQDPLRTFHLRLQGKVNDASQAVHSKKVFPLYVPPARYTGEKIGIEFLFDQSGVKFPPDNMDLEKQIDEGFVDDDGELPSEPPIASADIEDPTVAPPLSDHSDCSDTEQEEVSL